MHKNVHFLNSFSSANQEMKGKKSIEELEIIVNEIPKPIS